MAGLKRLTGARGLEVESSPATQGRQATET